MSLIGYLQREELLTTLASKDLATLEAQRQQNPGLFP